VRSAAAEAARSVLVRVPAAGRTEANSAKLCSAVAVNRHFVLAAAGGSVVHVETFLSGKVHAVPLNPSA